MKSFLAVYRKFLMGLTRVVGIIAGLLLFIPAFSVVYEVIMRGMFNSPTEWVVEISTYCVTIAGFLGMAVTFVANKHIKVDILLSHLSKPRCVPRCGFRSLRCPSGLASCSCILSGHSWKTW